MNNKYKYIITNRYWVRYTIINIGENIKLRLSLFLLNLVGTRGKKIKCQHFVTIIQT